MFYGMPIHIIRDVAITVRSFYKRISDFIRYRQATKDMDTRYPNATAEEIRREDVCIICREVMHASQPLREAHDVVGEERFQPKKLPCGHILHCTCLRSWLERQQNCPTCRAPVLVSNPGVPRSQSEDNPRNMRAQEHQPQGNDPIRGRVPQRNGHNTFNFGPFRLSFGVRQGIARDINNADRAAPRSQVPPSTETRQTPELSRQASNTHERLVGNISSLSSRAQLLQLEEQLIGEIRSLGIHATRLFMLRMLAAELVRLRVEANHEALLPARSSNLFHHSSVDRAQSSWSLMSPVGSNPSHEEQSLGAGQQGLPGGLILPRGWNTILLRRIEINEANARTISALPVLTNVNSRDPVTLPNLQRPSLLAPCAFDDQIMEQQRMLHESGINHGQKCLESSALDSPTKESHSNSDNFDTDIQIVRWCDEAEVEQRGIGQGHAISSSRGTVGHSQESASTYASQEPSSAMVSLSDSSLWTENTDQNVKLGSKKGSDHPDSASPHVDWDLEDEWQTTSRSQHKGKGKAVTVEDVSEEHDESQ